MTEDGFPFDEPTFEEEAEPDSVRGHRLEAEYGEFYVEVIQDGEITPEQRDRLDRAAEMIGLDPERVRRIEEGIHAAYARRELPFPEDDIALTPVADSLAPFAEPTDPRLFALQRRIDFLEAETQSLAFQLEEARRQNEELRAQIAVDLVQSFSPATPAPISRPDPEELQRRYEASPRDADILLPLFRTLKRAADLDRRVRLARVLVHLGSRDPAAVDLAGEHRSEVLLRPARALTDEEWRDMITHPDQEHVPGGIFAIMAPPVLLSRFASMRASRELPRLDPSKRLDPATTTVQAVRCFSWAAAILGIRTPPLYVDPEMPGFAEIVPDVHPATRLGAAALVRRTPRELAFLAGRHLTSYREEHLVGTLVSSHRELEDLFLAALSIVNPGLPMHAGMKMRVAPLVDALRPLVQPAALERLRGLFLNFVEQGGRTDLKRWTRASDLTAARAGLLLADDLDAAAAMLQLEDAERADARMDDLLGFYTGASATTLRRRLGVSIVADAS